MPNFSPEEILAFEQVYGPSGVLQEIHVTLNDGSEHLFKELREMCAVLAVFTELKLRERTHLSAPRKET